MTALEGGRAGLRSLLGRVTRWRVPPVWYGVALLGPIALQLAAMALHVALGGQPPDPSAMVAALPGVLLLTAYMLIQVGIGEEIGWRGYACPGCNRTTGALASAAILGAIWRLWHLPLFFDPATWLQHHALLGVPRVHAAGLGSLRLGLQLHGGQRVGGHDPPRRAQRFGDTDVEGPYPSTAPWSLPRSPS
jgi:membrane protease YdiL (CAAX protease family)